LRANRPAPVLLLAVLATLIALGFLRLFQLRFDAGDVYPPYSSLRADPLGSKALHDAYDGLPGWTVERNLTPLNLRDLPLTSAWFRVGETWLTWGEDRDLLLDFARRGGRLVVVLEPTHRTGEVSRAGTSNRLDRAFWTRVRRGGTNDLERFSPEDAYCLSFSNRLGFTIDFARLPGQSARLAFEEEEEIEDPDLPPRQAREVTWRSTAFFRDLSPEWKVWLARGGRAVLMERLYGRGSVVMASDAFFLSNEALFAERHDDLLAALPGGRRQIVFDETARWVVSSPGMMELARMYRLDGVLLALLVLAGLFIWRNSTSLVPPAAGTAAASGAAVVVEGRGGREGYLNLLRRSVPPSMLARTCVAEWKAATGGDARLRARLPEVEAALAEASADDRTPDPVETYRRIATKLAERKW
jgi:hypothetical protein